MLYTNEVQLIPLMPSEVAFVVCDVSVGDPSKNRVAGARVKVTSTATGKSVEDVTKDDGSVMFDIKELAIRGEDESSEDLKQYVFIGRIEITCEGYRDFLTGQMIVEGMQTHVIPTRKLEESMPYPERVSFDGWDVLYTDNTPSFSKANTAVHLLDVTLKNVSGSGKIHVALAEAATDKVVRSLDATPSGSEMTCRFGYHFMQEGHDDALTPETDYCIHVSQGESTWKFPIRLKPKTPIIDKPGTSKTLKPVKPVGDPKGGSASAKLPRLIPIGGGEALSGWIPDFGPVHVTVDPSGSASISLTIGEMEYPWGKSSEWDTPPAGGQAGRVEKIEEGNASGTLKGDKLDFEENEGWQWFPQKTIADQWKKKKDAIAKGKNNYRQAKASPDNNNISFSKVIKVNLKLVLFGTVTWDLLTKDSWDISANLYKNSGFSGVAGLALILSCDYTYCNNFLAGPVPVLFQFGFKASASAKATMGLVVRDTDPDRADKIKKGLSVKSWSEIMGDTDYWNCMLRSNIAARYYVMQIEPNSTLLSVHDEQLIPKIKNIRLAGIQDGNTRLHHWRGAGNQERFLAAWAPLWSSGSLKGQAESKPEDGSIDTPLCQIVISDPDSTNPQLSATPIGPKDFSMSSFGAYGDFIYWPGTKSGVTELKPTTGVDEAEVQLESTEPTSRSWLIGSRLRNGTFSEPFYLANLNHAIDHVVSITGAADALDVVCCGLVDREHGKGNVFRVRVPFVRCVTAMEAAAEIPYVVAGHDANFFIVIRNDGNTFIGGCTVEMWNEGSVAATASLAFTKDTTQESTYNPAAADGSGLEGVEPDWALAPGKTSIYKVTMRIPDTWKGDGAGLRGEDGAVRIPDTWKGGYDENGERIVKTVKFRVCSPTTKVSTACAVTAQAENFVEEGIEYSLPESSAPMEALEVDVYGYDDDIDVKDAPMAVVKTAAPAAASGGSTTGGAASGPAATTGVTGRGTVPSTGDSGGLGVGGTLAAAAGAAMLAYERRRAKNETQE